MTDAKSAWHEAGERFSSLGTKLKTHYEQKRGQDADQSKAEVRDALHRLTTALDDAFEAIGTAARDDAVKSDVKQVGQSLVTALGATFSQVSAEVQRQFANRTGPGDQPGTGEATGKDPSTLTEPAASPPASPAAEEGEHEGPPESPAESTAGGPAGGTAEGAAEGGQQPPRVEPWGTP